MIFFDFLDFLGFWIYGFLDFWMFCVLHLCFQSVETAPKLDSEKNGVCIGIYSVFKGCVYIYVYTSISISMIFISI